MKKKAQVITVAVSKGGTGKTATSGAVIQAAAAAGKKALAIDADPQTNLSLWFAADLTRPNCYDVITGAATAQDAVQATAWDNVFIICGNANTAAVKTYPGSTKRLYEATQGLLKAFDIVVIDVMPGLGEIQNNCLYAADKVVIPLESDSNSLQAFYQFTDIVTHIQDAQRRLSIAGVVITQYDRRPKINRFYQNAIEKKVFSADIPYLGEIRKGVAIRETMALHENLFTYAGNSKPAADYKKLYEKIMK